MRSRPLPRPRLKNPLVGRSSASRRCGLLSANLLTACNEPTQSRGALGDAARRASRRAGLRQCAGRRGPCAGLSARRASPSAARPVERADAAPSCCSIISEAARERLCRAGARSSRRNARGRGARRTARCLIDRLDELVAASGLAPRLRDHGIARGRHPDAGARGDEAAAPAGEQSRARSTKTTRGGCTRRPGEPPEPRGRGRLSAWRIVRHALGRQ